MTLPAQEYQLFYKMRRGSMFTASQNQNQSLRNAYQINITLGNMRHRGFLNLDTLKNLRSDCWTWVPVNTSENGGIFRNVYKAFLVITNYSIHSKFKEHLRLIFFRSTAKSLP